jgi:hypothetical protein
MRSTPRRGASRMIPGILEIRCHGEFSPVRSGRRSVSVVGLGSGVDDVFRTDGAAQTLGARRCSRFHSPRGFMMASRP